MSITLFDGGGFRWDVQDDGSISDGGNLAGTMYDAFDGGYQLTGFGYTTLATEDADREVVLGPIVNQAPGIDVTRKVYVSDTHGFARYLEIVTNTSGASQNYAVAIQTNLGSDGQEWGTGGSVMGSSGDGYLDATDQWVVSDYSGDSDPAVTHVFGQISSASATSNYVNYSRDLTLAPGETQIFMHFASQNATYDDAINYSVPSLLSMASYVLAGMSEAELSQVVNFDLGGPVDPPPPPPPPPPATTVSSDVTYTLAAEELNLFLTGSARINGYGNAADNAIYGNDVRNILKGKAGNDSLFGNAGNDILQGGAGSDTLDGGLGDDILYGGTGHDTYLVDSADDVILESELDTDHETVIASVSYSIEENEELEDLFLDGTALDGTGNAGNNSVVGNSMDNLLSGLGGNDLLQGGAGNDTLVAGAGEDILAGGTGDDVFRVAGGGNALSIDDTGGIDTLDATGASAGVQIDLHPGAVSLVDGRTVTVSGGGSILQPLDMLLLQDLSGSFSDDVFTVRSLVTPLVQALQTAQPDSQFGVASFVDKPTSPFGSSGDYVYQLDLPLTTDAGVLQSAVDALVVLNGNDGPEAQIEALMQVALRADEIGFRPEALRAVVLTTDAMYHVAGDASSLPANDGDAILDGDPDGVGEDYPDVAMVRDALLAANIVPIFAVTVDQMTNYQSLVDMLGVGAVVQLSSDSSGLVETIQAGLAEVARADIENAIGSNFADQILGNDLGNQIEGDIGNDVIHGNGGDDVIYGERADDTAITAATEPVATAPALFSTTGGINDFVAKADSGMTAEELANVVAYGSSSITVLGSTATFTGSDYAVSTYSQVDLGGSGGFVLGTGVLLTSGDGTPALSNTQSNYGQPNNVAGDAALNTYAQAAFSGSGTTYDASILEFSFTVPTDATKISLDIMFGSDEYPEFSNSSYVDIAAVEIDGVNYAYFNSDVTQPLSVITNNLLLGNFFDNAAGDLTIEYDGLSAPLRITGSLDGSLAEHTIRIAIADTGDSAYDSGLFVSNLQVAGSGSDDGISVIGLYDDALYGNDGNDQLYGGIGNDTLDGGAGVDTLTGGLGNDRYINPEATDVIVELSAGGKDTVESSISFVLGAQIEDLVLTGTLATNGTGNSLANKIIGNDAANVLTGAGAADTLQGGLGNDTYVVGAGDVVTELVGEGTDIVKSSVNWTLAVNVEQLILTGSALNGTGNTVKNKMTGNTANNQLSGKGGNDILLGGAGNDTLIGGVGNDTLTGGTHADTFRFEQAPGATNIDQITDFVVADDTIELENGVMSGLGAATGTLAAAAFYTSAGATSAQNASHRVIYNTTDGSLYFDADGLGGSTAVKLATVLNGTAKPALTYADFVIV